MKSTNILLALSALLVLGTVVVIGFLRSDWVGAWKPILDPQLILLIWVAELPIAYFMKYLLGKRVDRPVLEILDRLSVRSGQSEVEPTYYGVTVWNKGETMAEDCDVWVNIMGVQEFPVSWQPTRSEPVNIRPDRKETTETFRAVPLERTLEFPSDKGWNLPRPKLPFNAYQGTISIGAENCKPAEHAFKITFDETGNRLAVRLAWI